MKFADRYNAWSEAKKNVFLLGVIAIAGALILSFGFFIDLPGLTIGWVLGSIIEILAYLSIVGFSKILLNPDNINSGSPKVALVAIGSMLRFVLYAAGLALGALCTYVWKNNLVNLWTVFASYMPLVIVLALTTLIRNSKAIKKEKQEKGSHE